MRNMNRRLERLEAVSGTVSLHHVLHASKGECQRYLERLSDAELDLLIDELKADEEGVAI